jgi:hypothetical protein
VAQVVEHLPGKFETPSLNSSINLPKEIYIRKFWLSVHLQIATHVSLLCFHLVYNFFIAYLLILAVVGFELRTSQLLGRWSYIFAQANLDLDPIYTSM